MYKICVSDVSFIISSLCPHHPSPQVSDFIQVYLKTEISWQWFNQTYSNI
jgi:hypothetical protein